jgi:nucleoside-diphosphate-sugar epimerase
MENMVDPPPASSGTPRNGETSKILVTGAEGYIGYILSSRLLSIGYDVTGLDTGFYNRGFL